MSRIKTPDDLKEIANIAGIGDVVVNAWEAQTSDGDIITLHQVKGKALLRPVDIAEILSDVSLTPISGDVPQKSMQTGLVAVPCLMDAHFGKQAINGTYNAKQVYLSVAERMYQQIAQLSPDKIVYPVGSDLIHFDTAGKTTTLGTKMEYEGNRFDITKDVISAVITTINLFANIAPVEVIVLRGNHDDHSMTIIGAALSAMFENHEAVSVNDSPGYRKYKLWHNVLLGFTHGDKGRLDRIASAMPVDVPELWSKAKYRELVSGHFHHRQHSITIAHESMGVFVRYEPSLSPTDRWHDDNVFVGSFQGAELLFYGKDSHFATFSYPSHID